MKYLDTYNVEFFDIEKTAFCGQAFRFKKLEDNKVLGIFNMRIFVAEQNKDIVKISYEDYGNFESIATYLGLYVPAFNIKYDIALTARKNIPDHANDVIKIIESEIGIRILKQPILETCISYILSVNSNIPLISKRIEKLCALFSENKVTFLDKEYYFFPELEQLKSLKYSDLEKLKLGFRTDWIWNFIQKADEYKLEDLAEQSKIKRKKYLTSFNGIGEKVFNCINLYSYNDLTSFPVDVWIRRSLKNYFNIEDKKGIEYERYFGKCCGYFQQYLYNYSRNTQKKLS